MKKTLVALFLMMMLTPVGAAQSSAPDKEAAAKLRFAASQHEIISILLEDGHFSEVLLEFWKILDLGLTGTNEKPVVQEAWLVVDSLRKAAEYDLAHQVVDETLKGIELPENRFYLLMLRGKIYQDQGMTSEALETYRQAQALNPEE